MRFKNGRSAKRIVADILHSLGLEVTRARCSLPTVRARIMSDAQCDTVFDVGANRGAYAQELRRAGFAGHIYSFEPLAEALGELRKASIRDSRWTVIPAAVGDTPGQTRMTVTENIVSSSVLPLAKLHVDAAPLSRPIAHRSVEITTLDHFVAYGTADAGPPSAFEVGHLKIDVQGFERQVLAGATASIDRMHSLELEASCEELYTDQVLLPELLRTVVAIGFTLCATRPGLVDPGTGSVIQFDLLFRKCGGSSLADSLLARRGSY